MRVSRAKQYVHSRQCFNTGVALDGTRTHNHQVPRLALDHMRATRTQAAKLAETGNGMQFVVGLTHVHVYTCTLS